MLILTKLWLTAAAVVARNSSSSRNMKLWFHISAETIQAKKMANVHEDIKNAMEYLEANVKHVDFGVSLSEYYHPNTINNEQIDRIIGFGGDSKQKYAHLENILKQAQSGNGHIESGNPLWELPRISEHHFGPIKNDESRQLVLLTESLENYKSGIEENIDKIFGALSERNIGFTAWIQENVNVSQSEGSLKQKTHADLCIENEKYFQQTGCHVYHVKNGKEDESIIDWDETADETQKLVNANSRNYPLGSLLLSTTRQDTENIQMSEVAVNQSNSNDTRDGVASYTFRNKSKCAPCAIDTILSEKEMEDCAMKAPKNCLLHFEVDIPLFIKCYYRVIYESDKNFIVPIMSSYLKFGYYWFFKEVRLHNVNGGGGQRITSVTMANSMDKPSKYETHCDWALEGSWSGINYVEGKPSPTDHVISYDEQDYNPGRAYAMRFSGRFDVKPIYGIQTLFLIRNRE